LLKNTRLGAGVKKHTPQSEVCGLGAAACRWWRRGESNSCPKTPWHSFLRAYPFVCIPLSGRRTEGCRVG